MNRAGDVGVGRLAIPWRFSNWLTACRA